MLEKPVPSLFESSYHSLVIFFRIKTEEMIENDVLMDLDEVTDKEEVSDEEMAEEMFSGGGKPVKAITKSIEPNRPNSTVECTSSTD